jgi:DNA helicase-2/ATP-dependent DNA helicase PcrA
MPVHDSVLVFCSFSDPPGGLIEQFPHLCTCPVLPDPLLQTLLKNYDDYKNGSLYDFYLVVKADIKNDISKLSSGAAKTFYEGHTYLQLSLCVKIIEDASLHKTIHKAKGGEFDNVLLILLEEDDLAFLLNPALTATNKAAENQRINYVAVSRAKKRLFISVPSLQASRQTILSNKFQIEIL